MGLQKNTIIQDANKESATQSAIDRLSQTNEPTTIAKKKTTYEQRDYNAEAKGKVKCVMFQSALESPALAGLRFTTLEEFLELVKKAADAGVAYTWSE